MNWPQLESAWRSAWKPPQKYSPGDWAEKNFVLPSRGNAEPGKFRFARTPYLRGIVDAFIEPGVEDVVFVKPTRVGGTTAGQILLGYWIDNAPGNCLTVMPSEVAAEEEVKDRIRPMLSDVESLRAHVSSNPHDNTLAKIELDTMTIYTGWSGSPQSLGSRTCRYCRFDEVDKYVAFSGREADPISLGRERTGTYGHLKRHYITSTPTIREGAIWKAWEACGDRRKFWCPCPSCGKYQVLKWSQVKWPKGLKDESGVEITDKVKLADKIERDRLAWYECEHCAARIEDSQKPKMMERGVWASETQTVSDTGSLEGDRPHSRRVGFHLSSLYSPWRKFYEMVSEFIRADGDVAMAMNFRNSRLAEPFEIQVGKREASRIREKAATAGPPNIVPPWAIAIFATADVQKDHLYFTIRAWGYGFRSQLLRYGRVLNFDELYSEVFSVPCTAGNAHVFAELLAVDGKYRTNEVFEFAKRLPQRIVVTQGVPNSNAPLVAARPQGGVMVLKVNPLRSKDRLDEMINDGDVARWMPHAGVGDDYAEQLSSERKIWDQKAKEFRWMPKYQGIADHLNDCEANQCAVAGWRNMDMPAPEDPPKAPKRTVTLPDWMPSN